MKIYQKNPNTCRAQFMQSPAWIRLFKSWIMLQTKTVLKVNRTISFYCMKGFLTASVVRYLRLLKLQTEGQTIIKMTNLSKTNKTEIKILPFPGLA